MYKYNTTGHAFIRKDLLDEDVRQPGAKQSMSRRSFLPHHYTFYPSVFMFNVEKVHAKYNRHLPFINADTGDSFHKSLNIIKPYSCYRNYKHMKL